MKKKEKITGKLRIPVPPPGHDHGDAKKYSRRSWKKVVEEEIQEGYKWWEVHKDGTSSKS